MCQAILSTWAHDATSTLQLMPLLAAANYSIASEPCFLHSHCIPEQTIGSSPAAAISFYTDCVKNRYLEVWAGGNPHLNLICEEIIRHTQ